MAFLRHPSLRTGRADFPHPALQLVISPLRLARFGTGCGHREQPVFSEVSIGPELVVSPPHPSFQTVALAQDGSHSSPYPTVQVSERTFLAVLEVAKPSAQGAIHLRDDLFQAFAVGPSSLLANGFFELFQTLSARPFHASLKVVAEKIKASLLIR